MNDCKGGSPNNDGVVPIGFYGVSLLFSWIKNCDIWSVGAKMKLRELIGPLAVLVFNARTGEGEIEKDVCLKVVGKRWTINVLLRHWPTGSAAPKMLMLPVGGLDSETMCGEGGWVLWIDGSQTTVKRFAVTRTTRRDLYLWTHSMRLDESCGATGFYGTEEAGKGEIAEWDRDAVESEGELRAAQAARERGLAENEESGTSEVDGVPGTEVYGESEGGGSQGSAVSGNGGAAAGKRIKVVRYGAALEYDGHFYEFKGAKRWEPVEKLIEADGKYVEFGRGFKSLFAHSAGATAFFEAAVEAEGQGRNGTHRYRLKK